MNMIHRAARVLTAALFAACALTAVSRGQSAAKDINSDLKDALGQANKAGRTLLVDFYGGWCPWCVKMDETLAAPAVKAIMDKQFFYYKLDVGQFDKHTECIAQYGVKGIPFIAVFNGDGSVRVTQSGYSNPDAFVAFLTKAAFVEINSDLKDALAEANKSGKILLVDFYGGWCPWCVKMDETLSDAGVQAQLDKDFFYYKLDVGRFDKHTDCCRQYDVHGIPCFIAFTSGGAVLEQRAGYLNVAAFESLLTQIAGKRAGKWMALDFKQFKAENDAIASAVARCAGLDRRLIVYFYTDGTTEHSAMESLLAAVAGDPATAKFALLRVPQPENKDLASHYGCTATPFMILFKPDGNVSTFFQAAPEREEFLTALKKAAAQN